MNLLWSVQFGKVDKLGYYHGPVDGAIGGNRKSDPPVSIGC
jgi:hypothetical protein